MNMITSFTRSISTTFDTLTQGLIAVNHLARGAAERTVVVEEKSIAAAAMSELQNEFDVARRLQEVYKQGLDLSDTALEEGRAFLDAYKAKRRDAESPEAITKVIKDAIKAKKKAEK